MKLRLDGGLLYVPATLTFRGQSLTLDNVIIDTGSAGSVFATERLKAVGIRQTDDDLIGYARGIGGVEFILTKQVDTLTVGPFYTANFDIEMAAMSYGLDIDGIIGTDFLMQVGAVIDLAKLEIRTARKAAIKS